MSCTLESDIILFNALDDYRAKVKQVLSLKVAGAKQASRPPIEAIMVYPMNLPKVKSSRRNDYPFLSCVLPVHTDTPSAEKSSSPKSPLSLGLVRL